MPRQPGRMSSSPPLPVNRRQKTQGKENTLRSDVIELMKEHKIERVEIDSDRDLVLEDQGVKVKIKRKGDQAAE